MQQLSNNFQNIFDLKKGDAKKPIETIKQRLLEMCNNGILNDATKNRLLKNELSNDCLQLLDQMADVYNKDEFPNKFCERPIFEKQMYRGINGEYFVGYWRWHSDNPKNKIKLSLEEHKKLEEVENDMTWDNNKKKTFGWLAKEEYFRKLLNNEIGEKQYDKHIVEFIEREDQQGLF